MLFEGFSHNLKGYMPRQKVILVAFPDDLSVNLLLAFLRVNVRVVIASEKPRLWKPVLRKLKLSREVDLINLEDGYFPADCLVLVVDTYFYHGEKKTLHQKKNIYAGLKHRFANRQVLFLGSRENYSSSDAVVFTSALDIRFILLAQVYKSKSKNSYRLSTDFSELMEKLREGKTVHLKFSDDPIYPIATQTVAIYVASLVVGNFKVHSRVFGLAEEVFTLGNFLIKVLGKNRTLKIMYSHRGLKIGGNFLQPQEKIIYLGAVWPQTKAKPKDISTSNQNYFAPILVGWQKFSCWWPRKKVKYALGWLMITVFVLSIPFLTFLGAGVALSRMNTPLATTLFSFSAKAFALYSKVSFDNRFTTLATFSDSFSNLSTNMNKLTGLANRASIFGDVVLGKNQDKTFAEAFLDLKQDFNYYYRDVQFLLNDLSSLSREDLTYLTKNLPTLGTVIDTLPSVLGEGGEKRYLVMLQNNTELRPTGGFMGSFAILTFQKGILVEVKIHDVYDADGQLKGHVEPPSPISKYLGEANWFMRDANWDPDFVTSATRVMWFLQKEMDMEVDGVVAIDTLVIRNLVAALGEVKVPDYDTVISIDNFYEVIQYETEKDFFPGSTRKANFLSALSQELLRRLAEEKIQKPQVLATLLLISLQNKHFQIYFTDTKNQKVWEPLGLAWKFKAAPYTQALVEANVGVNKASNYLKRNIKVDLYPDETRILGKTSVLFENTAPPILGYKGMNKTYVRLFVPNNTTVEEIRVYKRGEESQLMGEVETFGTYRSEGLLVEIPNSGSVLVEFQWQAEAGLDLASAKQFSFQMMKQYGLADDTPVTVTLNRPLTAEAPLVYNCTLSSDCLFTFDFK